jgi:hypothetical protein
MRVVYVELRQCWWWNAWREATATELSGFAASQEEAGRAMYQAIEEAGPPAVLGQGSDEGLALPEPHAGHPGRPGPSGLGS